MQVAMLAVLIRNKDERKKMANPEISIVFMGLEQQPGRSLAGARRTNASEIATPPSNVGGSNIVAQHAIRRRCGGYGGVARNRHGCSRRVAARTMRRIKFLRLAICGWLRVTF